jgi:hypothetical protein
MNLRVPHLLLAAGIVILCTSCKEGNIYYTLENEVKVEDLSLPNDITVFDVAKIGSSYYAAAGKIWAADDSTVTWNTDVPVAPPDAGDICTALMGFSGELDGGFINASGNLGLYRSSSFSFSGQTALPDVAGAQIALLKVVDDGTPRLVVVTAKQPSAGEDNQFGIVMSSDGTNFSPFTFNSLDRSADEAKKQIWDVVYAGGTINAWFATEGTKLYTKVGAGTGEFILATTTGITAGEVLTGLFDDGTNVYVASNSGAVYYSPDGANWTRIEAPAISGTYPPLTRFAGPIDAGIVLVGSIGYGYYLLKTADLAGPNPLTRYPTTTNDLYTAAVLKFYYDSGKSRVFACTAKGGLWRGAVLGDGLGTINWNQE